MWKLLILSISFALAMPRCNLPNPIPTPGPSPSPTSNPSPVPSPSASPTPQPTPNPTPAPAACQDPSGNPTFISAPASLMKIIDDAVSTVKLENKSLFNGDLLVGWISDPNSNVGAMLAHNFYQKLQGVLAFAGHCSTLGSDDVGIQVINNGNTYEWYKLVVYTNGRIRPANESYEGLFLYSSLPNPSPSPISSGCPLKVDANHFIKVLISPFGGGNYTESTQMCVNSAPNDMPLPHCGTKCCNIGVIDVPPAYATCDDELFGGPPTWSGSAGFQVDPNQNYNIKVTSPGSLKACGSRGPCGEIQATP